MKKFIPAVLILLGLSISNLAALANSSPTCSIAYPAPAVAATPPKQSFYMLKIYQLQNASQLERVGKYLKDAYLPALHRSGIPLAGVFTAVENDTASIKKLYVLVPCSTLEQYRTLPATLQKDRQYLADGKDYLEAAYNNAPYLRIETILLQAFPDAPLVSKPGPFTTPLSDRIYELRSYEGPTESYFANKVEMFNKGGEIPLFQRLGFNAVFYGSVLSGPRMPNLMYMTSFDNAASHDAHWKAFGADPFWKQLVAAPEYQHNVSRSEIMLLHPTDYSDL